MARLHAARAPAGCDPRAVVSFGAAGPAPSFTLEVLLPADVRDSEAEYRACARRLVERGGAGFAVARGLLAYLSVFCEPARPLPLHVSWR